MGGNKAGKRHSLIAAVPWLLSVLWLLMPWSVGTVVGTASEGADRLFVVVAGIGLWLAWSVCLLASLIRRPWALTTVRLAASGSVAVAIAAIVWAGSDLTAAVASLALIHAVLITALALLPEIGNAFADGISYGNERRLLLRAPITVLAGPLPLAWVLTIGGIAAGPLALANRQWVLAGVLAVVGWPIAGFAVRSMHQLALRWLVFVPNGLVLIDGLATSEPVLLLRKDVHSVTPAPADVDLGADGLVDLSGNALGVPLLATMSNAVEVVPRGSARRPGRAQQSERVQATRVLFSPTRPGVALAAVIERWVGQAGGGTT